MFGYIKERLAFQGVVFRHLSQMYENLKTELKNIKKKPKINALFYTLLQPLSLIQKNNPIFY